MNDLELYIYIALALIYFLSRAIRKKKPVRPPAQKPRSASDDTYQSASPKERPLTFEDLLKEFTGQKEAETLEEEKLIETTEMSSSERKNEYEEDLYAENYNSYKEDSYKSYEEVYNNSKDLKTIDEQVSLNVIGRKRFDEYIIEKQENIHVANRFRKILKNSDTIRDAIILKEILDRRYF
jgi:hypothetical protein